MERVTSRSNPFVRRLSALYADGGARISEGLYICEGRTLLLDALSAGLTPADVLCADGAALPSLPPAVRLVYAPHALLGAVSAMKSPPEVIFTLPFPAEASALETTRFHILLDGVQDPGNVGSLLRTANAFGCASALLLPGCADPYAPKTVRASMGAIFRLPTRRVEGAALAVLPLPLVAAHMSGVDYRSHVWEPCVLALGSEGSGLSRTVLDAASVCVHIPLLGGVESLNVAAAAAVLLSDMYRR